MEEKTIYRMKFMPGFLFLYIFGLGVALISYFVSTVGIVPDLLSLDDLIVIDLVIMVFCALYSALMVIVFRTTLTAQSLKGQSFFGLKRETTWGQIESVKPFNMLFLKYLRVYINNGKSPLYLPLFLHSADDFKANIMKFVPKENPLRRFFESKVSDKV